MKYATVELADTYFSSRMQTDAWDIASVDLKTKALNHSERIFDRLSYKGLAITSGYAFPRDDQEEVPSYFLEAIYEEALSLLNNNSNEVEMSDLHVISSTVAGFQTSVSERIERPWVMLGLTSPIAWSLISPYLLDTKSFYITA